MRHLSNQKKKKNLRQIKNNNEKAVYTIRSVWSIWLQYYLHSSEI